MMQRIMGARFILHPAENPFGYASTFVPPGAKDPTADFSRGNACIYAVQGHDPARRRKIDPSDTANRLVALASVLKTCPELPFAETWGTAALWPPAAAAAPDTAAEKVTLVKVAAGVPESAAVVAAAPQPPPPASTVLASRPATSAKAPAASVEGGVEAERPATAAAAAEATVLTLEQTIKHLGGVDGAVAREATMVLSGGPLLDVAGMAAIDLEVTDSGDEVRVRVDEMGGRMGGDEMGGRMGGWHCFGLRDPINPDSVRAKFSRKRRTLTLVASCTG